MQYNPVFEIIVFGYKKKKTRKPIEDAHRFESRSINLVLVQVVYKIKFYGQIIPKENNPSYLFKINDVVC